MAVRPIQHGHADQIHPDDRVVRSKDGASDVAAQLSDGRANLAAGTSWLWVSPKLADAVDVLFVDEAGQISLANVVAVAGSAKSLVLLGDPQQLDQPMQGTHPPGADGSALAHVLGGQATIPPDRGLFLATTWRLHPALAGFTSEVFYDARLESEPHLARPAARRRRLGPRRGRTARDRGADRRRRQRVARRGGRGRLRWRMRWSRAARRGSTRRASSGRSTWDDVLIVAPYNAQVADDRAAAAARAPASARSTSSRARRRRSASTR